MARTFIGTINGRPAMKATADNDDLPWETPDDEYGKFLFNSEHKHAYIRGIYLINPNAWSDIEGQIYYVYPFASQGDTSIRLAVGELRWRVIDFIPPNAGLSWIPYVEFRTVSAGSAFSMAYSSFFVDHSTLFGTLTYTDGNVWSGLRYSKFGGYTGVVPSFNAGTALTLVIVWDLPHYNVPLEGPGAVVPGQMASRLTGQHAQLAKPGYDVRSAPARNYVFNSERIPAKVIDYGVTTCPPGTTYQPIDTTFPLSVYNVLETNVGLPGGLIYLPAAYGPNNQDVQLSYTVETANKRIRFVNSGAVTLSVRWILNADSTLGRTTGGSRVVYRGNDGVQDFYQIKIPGSSDDPNLRDILYDSRLKTLRIVAEGYESWGGTMNEVPAQWLGTRRKTVTFDNTGFVPFVKAVGIPNVVPDPGGAFGGMAPRMNLAPSVRRFIMSSGVADNHGIHGTLACSSAVVILGDNYVQLHLASGNYYDAEQEDEWNAVDGVPDSDGSRTVGGIRYYVFAL